VSSGTAAQEEVVRRAGFFLVALAPVDRERFDAPVKRSLVAYDH
jgi:hypothetical protein